MAGPLDEVLPAAVFCFAVIEDLLELVLLFFTEVIRANHYAAAVGVDVGFRCFLAWDALGIPSADQLDVEDVVDLHVGWQGQLHDMRRCLGDFKGAFPSGGQLF